jgi:hypothetical protein
MLMMRVMVPVVSKMRRAVVGMRRTGRHRVAIRVHRSTHARGCKRPLQRERKDKDRDEPTSEHQAKTSMSFTSLPSLPIDLDAGARMVTGAGAIETVRHAQRKARTGEGISRGRTTRRPPGTAPGAPPPEGPSTAEIRDMRPPPTALAVYGPDTPGGQGCNQSIVR